MASKRPASATPRAIIFLALAALFFNMAHNMDATWHRTIVYCIAVLDAVWGITLFIHSRRKPKN